MSGPIKEKVEQDLAIKTPYFSEADFLREPENPPSHGIPITDALVTIYKLHFYADKSNDKTIETQQLHEMAIQALIWKGDIKSAVEQTRKLAETKKYALTVIKNYFQIIHFASIHKHPQEEIQAYVSAVVHEIDLHIYSPKLLMKTTLELVELLDHLSIDPIQAVELLSQVIGVIKPFSFQTPEIRMIFLQANIVLHEHQASLDRTTSIGEHIDDGISMLSISDSINAATISGYATPFLESYAREYGIEKAIACAEKIPYVACKINGYIGIARYCAVTQSALYRVVMEKIKMDMKPGMFVGTDHEQTIGNFHRAIPILMLHPNYVEFLDVDEEHFSGDTYWFNYKSNRILAKSRIVSYLSNPEYLSRVAQEQHMSPESAQSIIELYTSAATKELIEDLLETIQQNFIQYFLENDLNIGLVCADLAHALYILSESGFNTSGAFIVLAQVLEKVQRSQLFEKSEKYYTNYLHTIAYYASLCGYLDTATTISKLIVDEEARLLAQTHFLFEQVDYTQIVETMSNISEDDMTTLIKDQLGNPDTLIALGYYLPFQQKQTEVETRAQKKKRVQALVLRITALPCSSSEKILILLGLSENEDYRHEALAAYVELIQTLTTSDREFIEMTFHHLHATQEYRIVSQVLFAVIEHKKTTNYQLLTQLPPCILEVVRTLMKTGNQKGGAIALQLFCNPILENTYPGVRMQLLHELSEFGFISDELVKYIVSSEHPDDLLDLLSFALQRYNVFCTVENLKLLEQETDRSSQAMKQKLIELFDIAKSQDTVIGPIDRCLGLQVDRTLRAAYYLRNAGKEQYGYVAAYPVNTYNALIARVSGQIVDNVRMADFKTHLLRTGKSEDEAHAILFALTSGEYPFIDRGVAAEHTPISYEFSSTQSLEAEEEHALRSLYSIMNVNTLGYYKTLIHKDEHAEITPQNYLTIAREYEGEYVLDRLSSNTGNAFSRFESYEELEEEAKKKKTTILGMYLAAINSALGQYCLPSEDKIAQIIANHVRDAVQALEIIQNRKKQDRATQKRYRIEYVEKGLDLFRFIRAVDVVPECVNSTYENAHTAYMARRVTDPCSFTFDIRDLSSEKIVGNVEGRLGINPQTNLFELLLVGIYSYGKTQQFVEEVLSFIERIVATPLRLGAINVSSKYGGVIELDEQTGYTKVGAMPLISYSPVSDLQGQPIKARGDDIIDGTDWSNAYDHNGTFTFTGYRKELPVFVGY